MAQLIVKRLTQLLALVLFVSLVGCDSKQMQRVSRADTILAFGDSLTFGTGSDPEDSYPEQLAAMADRTVINAGIPGETSAEGLRRLPSMLSEHRPALVILMHGGNDILQQKDLDKTKANLTQMIELITNQGAQVVLIGVPKFGITAPTAPLYIDLAEHYEIPADNDILSYLEKRSQYKSDNVHLNAEGNQQLARAIYELLLEHGALP